ncbi:GNAT family N-acetyltransferase [Cellulomonas sp. H30R-01]|uniref:GNAT family N-acetyltransferase n=1 Tax=Cellulomonas sp. H30R-01 TaxID=2704467 RepID=UPI00138D7CA8|nr:GNAT family N-acetyltransferase [Cellulomonas sp. H30R-01]QHT57732.1 GNAT family N-acetyltransferase [Cellulomonas sp. H30R-01]
MLTLRRTSPADTAFVADLYAATRADEVAGFGWDDATTAAFLRGQHAAREAAFAATATGDAVVEVDGVPVGRLVTARREAGVVHVLDVAVHPDHQGRGTGTAVLRGVLADAHAAGATVRLHVRATNVRAAALYARLGFVPVDDAEAPSPTAGTVLDVQLEARP